jgi:ubiquitin-activating enzyme E1
VDEQRLQIEDGETVTFTEVGGMNELNDPAKSFKVKITGQYTFTIGDTSSFSPYTNGGYVSQVKQPKLLTFVSVDYLLLVEFLPFHRNLSARHSPTQVNSC